ncbi:TerC/Alx family metal homeostasis membrane protein [Flavobacterium cerinum]|jgi:tellurite resistance protein TerC|uniref:TerC/Alx family metal homeostasis membrane protein n=1 Tax=Flavobacterium cerinum TaxID=2502784 RepID=A0A3S3QNS5_9FLAO|nr:TerC/Alx family metal homeostasis membrane protein [Flavobacterium cerinum]RWW96666.1 TerC/Alx family metal homeostasis membrane protein [Flavobacterium cerinum]
MDNLINHPGIIAVFSIVVVIMLLLDLGVFNKKSHTVTNKEAIAWSLVWISLSMIFSGVIYYYMGIEKFSQFQSAYWIEKALSVDNLFVFILVFGFFNVPKENHHKVLFWGIIGALVLRAVFIFSGVGLIKLTYLPEMVIMGYTLKINVVLTLFGIFLIYAGIKSWFAEDDDDAEKDFNKSPGAKVVNKFFNVSKNYDGDKFFTIENGKKLATPLLVVVGVIEFTDLLFAVDSIPAIFAIAPDDPFILYTSNIFAILGLRALYFLLANFIHLFSKLKYGLALILAFIGVKMVISPLYHIESLHSLIVVAGVLILSVVASVMFPEKEEA